MAAPHPRPLGILCPELPRLRTARLPRCPLQAILRQVLACPHAPRLIANVRPTWDTDRSRPRRYAGGPMATSNTETKAIEAARAFRPRILAERDRIEAGRRLPEGLARDLARAGFFRIFFPP